MHELLQRLSNKIKAALQSEGSEEGQGQLLWGTPRQEENAKEGDMGQAVGGLRSTGQCSVLEGSEPPLLLPRPKNRCITLPSDAAPAPGGAYKSPGGRRSGGEAALNSPEPRHPCHHCHRYRQESRAAITAPASTISRVAAPGLQLPVASAAARGSDAAPAPGGAYKSPRGRRSGGEAALNSPEPRHPCHHCHRYRQESRAVITAPASTISRVAAPGLQLPVASAAALTRRQRQEAPTNRPEARFAGRAGRNPGQEEAGPWTIVEVFLHRVPWSLG
ncbi:hypothetical protein NDU88_002420 [Pleurodeles waltl]|uniref:Uncharacterized protein n=1 Tax=Pleurodeles waltl TaxID=8319 RepID=A0AAV7NDY3_PLEWA|nr:hypothetical protein NDU88_002420 [Pleurodeles waltl]